MQRPSSFIQRNPFFRVIFREIDRMSSSFVYLFLTLVGPLLSFIVLTSLFSDGVPRDLPVAVVDLDNSSFSRKIALVIDAAPEVRVAKRTSNTADAFREMQAGAIDAVIIIPRDTERNILHGGQQTIPVHINNTNILKGGYLQKGLMKTLGTLSGGVKLKAAMKSGLSEKQARAKIQPVVIRQQVLFNPFGNYSYFLLSALLPLMLIVFTLLSAVYAIGIELKEGTGPDWLNHAAGSITVAIAGKLIPYTLLFSIVAVVMNVILFIQNGTPLQGSFLLLLLGECMLVICYQLLALVLVATTANLRLSLSLASAYSMMALTFSGLTFPQVAMPLAAQWFSYLFPFTWWIKLVISQSIRGEELLFGLAHASVITVFMLISAAFIPRMKRILLDTFYWGRI